LNLSRFQALVRRFTNCSSDLQYSISPLPFSWNLSSKNSRHTPWLYIQIHMKIEQQQTPWLSSTKQERFQERRCSRCAPPATLITTPICIWICSNLQLRFCLRPGKQTSKLTCPLHISQHSLCSIHVWHPWFLHVSTN